MTSDINKTNPLDRKTSSPFPKLGGTAPSVSVQALNRDLQLYQQASALIERVATSTSFEEVRNISDYAAALEKLARIAEDKDLEMRVAEIRLRAKRRIGEMTSTLLKLSGCNLPNVESRDHLGKGAMLAAAGISRAEANRCEQIAKIESGEFEQYIEDKRANGAPISASDVVKTVAKKASRHAVMQRRSVSMTLRHLATLI